MNVRHVSNSKPRHAAILVVVLVSLLVATMLAAGLIQTVLSHQRQMRILAGQQQSFWLAEAGIQRAILNLEDAPDYEGETWDVTADLLGDSRTAIVTIDVAVPSRASTSRQIHVAVHLDDGRAQPTGYHRELQYQLTITEPEEQSEKKAD